MNVYFIIILFSLTKILTAWQNLKWNLFKTENEIFFTAATSCTSNWANQIWANHPIFLHTTFMHILSTKNKIDESTRVEINPVLPLHIYILYIYFYHITNGNSGLRNLPEQWNFSSWRIYSISFNCGEVWEYIYNGLETQSSHVQCTPLVSRLRLTLLYRQYTLYQLPVYIKEASYVSSIVDSIMSMLSTMLDT